MAGPVKEFEVHPYVQFMMDKYSPYKKWIESEGIPIIGGAFVQDVRIGLGIKPARVRGDARVVVELVPHRGLARPVLPVVTAGLAGAGDADVADPRLFADAGEHRCETGGLAAVTSGRGGNDGPIGLGNGGGR